MMNRSPTPIDPRQATYLDEGWITIPDLLSPAEVEQARKELRRLAQGMFDHPRAAPAGGGHFSGHDLDYDLQIEPTASWPPEPKTDPHPLVRKLQNFVGSSEWFRHLALDHPGVRPTLEAMLGEEVVLYQSMALVKPARIGSEKPWHQDDAYFAVDPLEAIGGIWIALDDATAENGCMHVLPGGHHRGALRHHHTSDCEILEGRVDRSQAVPVVLPAGGAMVFSGLLPHQTPPNRSDQPRRALQFHYRTRSSRILEGDAYDRVFCEADGTPASCEAARQAGI